MGHTLLNPLSCGIEFNETIRPCSVHDVDAALDYASKLKAYADSAIDDLHILMRVYFEK